MGKSASERGFLHGPPVMAAPAAAGAAPNLRVLGRLQQFFAVRAEFLHSPSSRIARISSFVSPLDRFAAEARRAGRTRLSLGGTLRRFCGTLGGRLLSCSSRCLGRRDSRCVGRCGILRPGTAGPPDRRCGLVLGRQGRGSGFQNRFRGRGRRVRKFCRTAGVRCVGSLILGAWFVFFLVVAAIQRPVIRQDGIQAAVHFLPRPHGQAAGELAAEQFSQGPDASGLARLRPEAMVLLALFLRGREGLD